MIERKYHDNLISAKSALDISDEPQRYCDWLTEGVVKRIEGGGGLEIMEWGFNSSGMSRQPSYWPFEDSRSSYPVATESAVWVFDRLETEHKPFTRFRSAYSTLAQGSYWMMPGFEPDYPGSQTGWLLPTFESLPVSTSMLWMDGRLVATDDDLKLAKSPQFRNLNLIDSVGCWTEVAHLYFWQRAEARKLSNG